MEDPYEAIPCDLMSCNDPQILSEWLSKFVIEVHQESEEHYPPRTIQSILHRISRDNGVLCNFLDKNDSRFSNHHKTLDTLCSKLHSEGVGATVHSTPVISVENEQLLLDGGVLSMDNPMSLLYMFFYFFCLHCCLRGGQKHYLLISLRDCLLMSVNMMLTHTMTIQISFQKSIYSGLKISTAKTRSSGFMLLLILVNAWFVCLTITLTSYLLIQKLSTYTHCLIFTRIG